MRKLILAMAMASTLFTPALASAADRPGDRAERRAERQVERRTERHVERRAERRADYRQDRRAEHREDRREVRREVRRADIRRDRRQQVRYDRQVQRQWNRDWRQDRRYDYNRYRAQNRGLYRVGRYSSPYNRGYSRLSIGISLGSGYYGSRYQISDPYRYRLPPAYGPYRWVRYYNDAVLVNVRTGRVRDVINNFFY